MKRETVSEIMLTLLLIGMLTMAFNVQPAKAEPKTWTVDDDGPADFSRIQDAVNAASLGDTIFVYNGTYNENVVLNKTLTLVGENRNMTIIDALPVQDSKAIMITAGKVNVSGFTIRNAATGIFVDHSAGHTITENIVTLNDGGIYMYYSSSNYIANNVIKANRYGLYVSGSPNNLLRNNVFSEQVAFNLWVSGSLPYLVQDIDTSNTVDGKPIYYWVNQNGKQVPSDAGLVAIVNSTNITAENLNITKYPGDKTFFAFTTDSYIRNSSLSEIHLQNSDRNVVSGNLITGGYGTGIRMEYSDSNSIIFNKMDNNTGTGIYLFESHLNFIGDNEIIAEIGDPISLYWTTGIRLSDSHRNTISGNEVSTNVYAIELSESENNIIFDNTLLNSRSVGLWLMGDGNIVTANYITGSGEGISSSGHENTFSWNTISNNTYGFKVRGAWWDATNNYIIANLVANNTYGLSDSMDNSIYLNNFINNTIQMRYSERNAWDDGNGKGNYWSDYLGDDLNGDGVGNTLVPHLGVDWYPLMEPWIDLSPPTTTDNYDGKWRNADFEIILTATDEKSGVQATYYKINDGSIKNVQTDDQPYIRTEGSNNKLEYWSVDKAGNEEKPHNILTEIKLDKTRPTADADVDQTINEDSQVTFDGSASSDENGIARYTWTFTDVTPKTSSGKNPIYNFTTPGTYVVILTVEDKAGNTATDTVTITVLLDTDRDGMPDVTDPDDDNDGVPDVDDAFPLDASESLDTDSDGVGNNADPDDDNDGISDTWETENGLNPLDAADASLDPDGDGLANLQEYQQGTDPNVSDAEPPLTEGFPLWMIGVAGAVAFLALTVALVLWRRKGTKTQQTRKQT